MLLERNPDNPILSKNVRHEWESQAVLNSCVQKNGDEINMLYRTLSSKGITRSNGREYHYSYIGHAKSRDGINFERETRPLISPEEPWENLGCEDPRFVKLGNTNYIFYTAVSLTPDNDIDVQIAGAVTGDFKTLEKYGVISLEGKCKAATLFTEKVNGKYAFLYTQDADSPKSTIYYSEIDKIEDLFDKNEWGKITKNPLISPSSNAHRGPELGAPPIKTDKGWLLIYCPESYKREWFIGAALLDLKDPKNVIARTHEPLLKPEMEYELHGYENNVAFPEGAIVMGENLYVYYGGADQGVCLATCKLDELLASLG